MGVPMLEVARPVTTVPVEIPPCGRQVYLLLCRKKSIKVFVLRRCGGFVSDKVTPLLGLLLIMRCRRSPICRIRLG